MSGSYAHKPGRPLPTTTTAPFSTALRLLVTYVARTSPRRLGRAGTGGGRRRCCGSSTSSTEQSAVMPGRSPGRPLCSSSRGPTMDSACGAGTGSRMSPAATPPRHARHESLARQKETGLSVGYRAPSAKPATWQREHLIRAGTAWRSAALSAGTALVMPIGCGGALLLVGYRVVTGDPPRRPGAGLRPGTDVSSSLEMVVGMLRWLVSCLDYRARFLWLHEPRCRGSHAIHHEPGRRPEPIAAGNRDPRSHLLLSRHRAPGLREAEPVAAGRPRGGDRR
jgi:hypothetical protein